MSSGGTTDFGNRYRRRLQGRNQGQDVQATTQAIAAPSVPSATSSSTGGRQGWLILGGAVGLGLAVAGVLWWRRHQRPCPQVDQEAGQQLLRAIYQGDVAGVKALCSLVDPTAPVLLHETPQVPFAFALHQGAKLDIVEALLGSTHLNLNAVSSLLPACASLGRTDVIAAILTRSNVDPVAADDEGLTAAHVAAKIGSVSVLEALYSHAPPSVIDHPRESDGATPLMVAVAENEVAAVKFLLQAPEVDPSAAMKNSGITSLMIAATKGATHMDVMELLLAHPRSSLFLDAVASDGRTALAMAAKANALPCVERLLQEGANPSGALGLPGIEQRASFMDCQPLVLAAMASSGKGGSLSVMRLLADAGADVDAPLSDGRYLLLALVDGTPLGSSSATSSSSSAASVASAGGTGGTGGTASGARKIRHAAIELLLELGADPHKRSAEIASVSTGSAGGAALAPSPSSSSSSHQLVSRTATEAAEASGDEKLLRIFAEHLKL